MKSPATTPQSAAKFLWNGIKVDGTLHLASYSADTLLRYPAGTITIYGKRYKDFPKIDGLNVQNDSDMMTDYFQNDRIRVEPSNPHYEAVLAAWKAQEEHRAKMSAKRVAKVARS